MKGMINALLIELKPSKMIKGEIGLFSARRLKKGTLIARATEMNERFIPWTEYFKADKKTQTKIKQFCLQNEEGFYSPPDLNYLSVPWYMNHSCSYNVGFDKEGNFVATRDIEINEELSIDYGLAISNPSYRLSCKCKSKNCRRVITGNDWQDDSFVRINKNFILRELLELYNKKNTSVIRQNLAC